MKYIVKKTAISHNKVVYKEGSVIELGEDEAKKLSSYLEELETTEDSKKSKKKTLTTESEITDDQNNETRSG